MRRYAITAAFTAVLLVFISSPVAAGLQWCPRDPIVSLNGQEVQIWVAIPEQYQTAVTGPIRVDVRTPGGVRRQVLFTDEGFNGFGEQVTFSERGQLRGNTMNVVVSARVPYDRSMVENADLPILLTVVLPDGSVIEVEDVLGSAKIDFEIPANP